MADEVYIELREFLDQLPPGYPTAPSGVELRILRKLFTEEDARMALCLTMQLETASEIAGRLGMDESGAAALLESMARRGLIHRSVEESGPRYKAMPFLVGIYEGQLATIDLEFAEMMKEYSLVLGQSWARLETAQMRMVPVASAVERTDAVITYDDMREVVRRKGGAYVTDCICRKQMALLGRKCEHPIEESCMAFEDLGMAIRDYGIPGKELSVEEALAKLDQSEELGLILRPDNTLDPRFICCCCTCGDPQLMFMKKLPNPSRFTHSNYISSLDVESCNGCAACVERCPMDAIAVEGDVAALDPVRCIGCGLCLGSCPADAITLVQREVVVEPPLDLEEQYSRIMRERGLA